MAEEDYLASISDEAIDQRGMAKMDKLKHQALRSTAEYIRKKGHAGYQERLLEDMADDLLSLGQKI